jgi:hypothetical protein
MSSASASVTGVTGSDLRSQVFETASSASASAAKALAARSRMFGKPVILSVCGLSVIIQFESAEHLRNTTYHSPVARQPKSLGREREEDKG